MESKEKFYNLHITYKNTTTGFARMSLQGIVELLKNEIDNIKKYLY